MTDVTRRDFLSRSSSLVAAGAAAATLASSKATQAAAPQVASNTGPQKNYTLTAQWVKTTLNGTPVKLRGWNGMVPGPLLEARPGDTMNVKVVNDLTPYDSSAWNGDHNIPHDLNTTNLHVHGLEVRPHLFEPLGTSDPHAPMIAIPPEGGSKQYSFEIPKDQPPGLFWYHPHKHGSTVVQAVSGMAGGIVIRGDIDEVPEIKAAADNILVIQDIGLFPTDNPAKDGAGTYIYEPKQNAIWQTFGGDVTIFDPKTKKAHPAKLNGGFTTGDYALRYFLINGKPFFEETHNAANPKSPIATQLDVPTYTMAPGAVARFRMLNANSDDVMPIYLEGHDLHLIGMDGVNLPTLRTLPKLAPESEIANGYQLLLAPANRGEFLVKASLTPGTYNLVQSAQTLQFLDSARRILAKVVVEGDVDDMALPAKLPAQHRHFPLIPDSEVSKTRVFEFGMQFPGQMNPFVGIDFMLNNQLYDEMSVATNVTLGTVEDWVIKSPAHPGGDPSKPAPAGHFDNTEGHPFHVHVNSFELIETADVDPNGVATNKHRFADDEVLIQDTIWVPMGKQVTIRTKFKQWIGKSVFHCHILPHEDTGMMQNFTIHDPKTMKNHGLKKNG